MDAVRSDPAAVAALRADPAAGLLVLTATGEPEIADGRLVWGTVPAEGDLALLGTIAGRPLFAAIPSPAPGLRRSTALMTLLMALDGAEAATYAAARSLIDWHARHGFCAQCGAATAPFRAGWARACAGCGAQHFPRTDPVVIMLAEHGDRILVGRQAMFPPGRYSALAGFVEVGESMEEAVARELAEEAGVRATAVRYCASQPWPFASSLMLACIAQVADDAITLDTTELEDAMWVDAADVRAALAEAPGARFLPPPDYAIANTLFRHWLAGQDREGQEQA
ncbi:MAG: NAD(+) diphosphatase [Sphingomonas fennica]